MTDAWEYDAKGYFSYDAKTKTFAAEASDLDFPIDMDIWPDAIAIKGNRETKVFELKWWDFTKWTYVCEDMRLEVLND